MCACARVSDANVACDGLRPVDANLPWEASLFASRARTVLELALHRIDRGFTVVVDHRWFFSQCLRASPGNLPFIRPMTRVVHTGQTSD